jgi:hypothetical protein
MWTQRHKRTRAHTQTHTADCNTAMQVVFKEVPVEVEKIVIKEVPGFYSEHCTESISFLPSLLPLVSF